MVFTLKQERFTGTALLCLFWSACGYAEDSTFTATPGNPWNYNSELIFSVVGKEVGRQHSDTYGSISPVSGNVPDGTARIYTKDGKLDGTIPFKNNAPNGLIAQEGPGALRYVDGKLEGTSIGYNYNDTLRVIQPWHNGKPVGIGYNFDADGRLEMESDIRGPGDNTEKHFYPDSSLKSEWIFKNNNVAEAREYTDGGGMSIDAKEFAKFETCSAHADKKIYTVDEQISFSVQCHCPDPKGCFAPVQDTKWPWRWMRWLDKIVLKKDKSPPLALLYCPMDQRGDLFITSDKALFKGNETVAKIPGPYQQKNCGLNAVEKSKLEGCKKDFDCKLRLFNESAAALAPGNYRLWLDNGASIKTDFTVK